ncbi:hypothetical protein [Bacillus phage BUCT082]|nr:hypothetical protein [Bacillus phage BUCT082]
MKIWIGCGNGSAMGTFVPLFLPLDVNIPPYTGSENPI